jgi:hypothetical protein
MTVPAGHPGPLNTLVIVSSLVSFTRTDIHCCTNEPVKTPSIAHLRFLSPLFSLSLSPYSRIQIQCLRFLVLLARFQVRLLWYPGWKAFPTHIGSNVTAQLRDIERSRLRFLMIT